MITISNLRIEEKKELSYLLCDIQDDVQNKKNGSMVFCQFQLQGVS